LEYNFPGFVIVGLDREDPELIESREACRNYAATRRGISTDEFQPRACEGEVPLAQQAMASVGEHGNVPPTTMDGEPVVPMMT
jgi:hypothetical protein